MFLSQRLSGTHFDCFSPSPAWVLRQVSQACGFESSPQSSVSSPCHPTRSFWFQRNTLKLCLRTGRPWQRQFPQCPAFRCFNPFMRSVSSGKSPILSGPGIDTSYGRKTRSLRFPECSKGWWKVHLRFREGEGSVARPKSHSAFPWPLSSLSIHPWYLP